MLETFIGCTLITGVGLRWGLLLLAPALVGMMSPLVLFPGDMFPGLGFKEVTTGDTLCDREHLVVLERMEFPEPVIHVAIEPKTKTDQDKLGKALKSLSDGTRHGWRSLHNGP